MNAMQIQKPRVCIARRGFSLIELLTVVAVMSLMLTLLTPVISSFARSQGMTRAVNEVSMLLDAARSEAVTKNTYVWLGFENTTVNLQNVLLVGMVRSRDGASTLSNGNYTQVGKVLRFVDVRLVGTSDLDSGVQSLLSSDPGVNGRKEIASETSAPFLIGQQNFSHNVLFSPQGEIIVPGTTLSARTPFSAQLLVGLRTTRGPAFIEGDRNTAGIVLHGGTGSQRILRN